MSTGLQNELPPPQLPPPQLPPLQLPPPQLPPPQLPPPPIATSSMITISSGLRDQVFAVLNDADIKTLREVIVHCNNLLTERQNISKNVLFNQFSVIPDILSQCSKNSGESTSIDTGTLLSSPTHATDRQPMASSLFTKVSDEVRTLGLEGKSGSPGKRKVATQWLIKDPQNTNLPSEDMAKFPAISELCKTLSQHMGDVNFNSCIVNYYADGAARTRSHSDDESYVDQDCPIACFSIGASRDIAIFDKQNGSMLGKHLLEEGSLLTMNPGAQANTRHQILSSRSGSCGERFSLSFRRIRYTEVKNEWPIVGKPSISTNKPTNHSQRTTLILGTSIPYYLNYDKLSGSSGKTKVENLCQRGAKISTLQNLLDDHYKEENPDEIVDKIILSVGTNDLRNNKKPTVGHLYTPMENLLSKIKSYYPGATIYIQSLLPQRVQNAFTVSNVLGFNKLLIKLCALNKCLYLDIFSQFLGPNNHPNPSLYRWDGVHLNNKGLSVLARVFIDKIRGRFNPIV